MLYSSAQLKGNSIMQASPASLTLSLAAKNIHSKPTCCSHQRISLLPWYVYFHTFCYIWHVFSFTADPVTRFLCLFCSWLVYYVHICINIFAFLPHDGHLAQVQSLKKFKHFLNHLKSFWYPLFISSVASQHVWWSPLHFHRTHDWLVCLIRCHLPRNKGKSEAQLFNKPILNLW